MICGGPEREGAQPSAVHLGMSPGRYLRLRRMSLASRALARAVPGARTITQIATDFAFWELGRFAVEYRNLFGESRRDIAARPW